MGGDCQLEFVAGGGGGGVCQALLVSTPVTEVLAMGPEGDWELLGLGGSGGGGPGYAGGG